MRDSGTLASVASRRRCEFLQDVLTGLGTASKNVPCKYFYDKRGSELFDRICKLGEYYLTRSELSIMEASAPELAEQIGPGAMVVEFGSGSSVKTRYLLDALLECVAYVPVDISSEHLDHAAAELASDYPRIEILPVCADFTKPFELPLPTRLPSHSAVYFPGSTIGNFTPELAIALLRRIALLVGQGGGLIIGIDVNQDVAQIEAAYNDSLGVTARFNLNLLRRINDDLEGDFRLDSFEHRALYNAELGRVELDLVSRIDQCVTVAGEGFTFSEGEAIHTEYSYKYSIPAFAALAASAGLSLHRYWTDRHDNCAVLHLVADAQETGVLVSRAN